ncbi:CFE protein [Tanacetum coccineum]|uniref:CFE protein n=1 Tax=Tanacetum coccineum TaxID=301880 RepID=A0ABQ5GZ00_9ASTR
MFIIPSILTFVPVLYSTILSWLRPPYLYVIINTIIITIAATSRFHHTSKQKVQSSAIVRIISHHVLSPRHDCLRGIYNAVTRSTWQSPVEKVQTEFVFPVREKPLASSRFAGQRKLTAKVNPEGARSLRVSKPKKHETLESTWKMITDGRHIPLNRHLKKSDTFENHNQDEPKLEYNVMKNLETFNDRTDRVLASRKLRKEGSPSQNELNRRVEAKINAPQQLLSCS